MDKERTLVFDLNAFADLEEMFGSIDEAMQALQNGKIKALRAILWAGLKHEDEELTEREVGKMITLNNMKEVMEGINTSINLALPEVSEEERKN